MLDRIPQWFGAADWGTLLDRFSNDKIVAFFTQPTGLGILGALVIASIVFKKRVLFVVIAAALAVATLARYALAGHTGAPNKAMYLFVGGGVAIAAFIIYFLFIREE